MEVHHHAHPTSGGTRKKWTHYLWEFLMLFLAVFCGFLAENQREHIVERRREKQFIGSYIEDLETDTASIRRTMNFLEHRQLRLDSFMLMLKSHQIKGFENTLYYFGRTLIRSSNFRSNDRTMTELLNSGSLRLIRNKQVTDSMIYYKGQVASLEGNQEDELQERKNCMPILEKIYDPFVFDTMVDDKGIHRIDDNPPLSSYEPELQKELAHRIHQLKGSNFLIVNRLKSLQIGATNLIALFKKAYHLK